MKQIWIMAFIVTAVTAHAQVSTGSEAEVALIKQIIQTSYVEGLQNEGDTFKVNLGFHPGFELLSIGKDGELGRLPIQLWKEKVAADRGSGRLPREPEEQVSVRFVYVDISGNAAQAKFEFYVGNKLTFMDYLSLYKFEAGWKIVSKVFHKY